MQRVVTPIAILTRPTLGDLFSPTQPTDCVAIVYPGRALFPGGDGETQCSKIDSGKAPDRSSLRSQGVTTHCGSTPRVSSNGLSTSATKFAEPSNDRAAVYPALEQEGGHPLSLPLSGVRVGRAKEAA